LEWILIIIILDRQNNISDKEDADDQMLNSFQSKF